MKIGVLKENKPNEKRVALTPSAVTKIKKLGFEINISKKAKEFLVDKGYDKKYGARPLNRAIQKYLEDLIAQEIVTDSIKENDSIKIDVDNKNSKLSINIEG